VHGALSGSPIVASGRAIVQAAAGQAGILTDADRESLLRQEVGDTGSIVADRLISWNGAISLALLLSSGWVVKHPEATRRLWRRLGGRARH
jgi:hypothetical protein